MLSITKQFRFEACHHLPFYDGACRNLHGHSYLLEVTVIGPVCKNKFQSQCGMIIDFNELKRIVEETVLSKVDHANLNDIYSNPTAETMVVDFFNQINFALPMSVRVKSCKLWETTSSYAEYTGE